MWKYVCSPAELEIDLASSLFKINLFVQYLETNNLMCCGTDCPVVMLKLKIIEK